jgi:hypothetical protein
MPPNPDRRITPDEAADIEALGSTLNVLAILLGDPETATPAAVRMGTAALQQAAHVLDQIADRWDTNAR